MSYARFFLTPFYVYWASSKPDPVKWEDEIVEVNCEHSISAGELSKDIKTFAELCVSDPYTDNPLNVGHGKPREELINELIGYLQAFLDDVKSHYQQKEPP